MVTHIFENPIDGLERYAICPLLMHRNGNGTLSAAIIFIGTRQNAAGSTKIVVEYTWAMMVTVNNRPQSKQIRTLLRHSKLTLCQPDNAQVCASNKCEQHERDRG
jgi:hypothetical protein